jgi:hypothetical protein
MKRTSGLAQLVKNIDDKQIPVNVRLRQSDLTELDHICKENGLSRQAAIENAVKDWIADAKKTLAAKTEPARCPYCGAAEGELHDTEYPHPKATEWGKGFTPEKEWHP